MAYRSPYGDEFRSIMDAWDHRVLIEQIEDLKSKIMAILDRVGMVIRHNGRLYCCDEGQRIKFSVLRKPHMGPADKGEPKMGGGETFGAIDLAAWLTSKDGQAVETAIDAKGAKKCQVVSDRDEVITELLKALDVSDGKKAPVPTGEKVISDRARRKR